MLRLALGAGPPLGCSLLMILMVLGALLESCSKLELHLDTLQNVWDGHRLLSHALCAPNTQLLVISLLLILLLYWRLEKHLGTVYFLHLSCLCTLGSAILYLLISLLLPWPVTYAYGFLATQLSLLVAKCPAVPWRLGRRLAPLLPCGILIAIQLVWPESPLLLHVCGVINGLAVRAGLLHFLDVSYAKRHALDKTYLCHCLASLPLAPYIPTREEGSVENNNIPKAKEQLPYSYTDVTTSYTDLSLVGVSTQSSNQSHLRDISVWLGDPGALEDEMLEAGILASLRDYKQETQKQALTLNKSSVSALRLQQLERMGFPTGPAVVALAATGKVESAVSLLVEGEIGEDITVASERQTSTNL